MDLKYKSLYVQGRVYGSSNVYRNIVYCPTKMITGQVFRFILEGRGQNWMQGYRGVAKTFAFILYIILSNYVIDFRMKYPNNSEGQKM
jgi:hypothetical protein